MKLEQRKKNPINNYEPLQYKLSHNFKLELYNYEHRKSLGRI